MSDIYCVMCQRKTDHELLQNGGRSGQDEVELWYWEENWYVYECKGCKHVVFKKESCWSEELDEHGRMIPTETFYPSKPEVDNYSIQPQNYMNIPEKLENLYTEVIKAYNSKSYVLVSTGLRSLLEGICNDKGVAGDRLSEKINNLTLIPEHIRSNIHALRFIGNDATHDLIIPTRFELLEAIEIIQDILNIVYSLDYRSTMLYQRVLNRRSSQ